ncbi:HAD hydrolase family protein [Liquorilactobacillus mali]|nr:HAD hydrolase family protein [Liquorilactobacillus mali]
MIKIKVIAIDIDDTLVNSEKKLTTAVKLSIQKAKDAGIKVVLCTGSSFIWSPDLTETVTFGWTR